MPLVNDALYERHATLFTENVRRAHPIAAALKAGTVWVDSFSICDLRVPFEDINDSGVGRRILQP